MGDKCPLAKERAPQVTALQQVAGHARGETERVGLWSRPLIQFFPALAGGSTLTHKSNET